MTDQTFGELKYEEGYGWLGKLELEFGGASYPVELLIHEGREKTITNRQREAYERFMEKWPALQPNLIEALIRYYNEEEYYSYGPEDEEEAAEWWPEIKTGEALLAAVTPETIVVTWDFAMDDKRCIYLLFSRIWGGEDLDDNGIGVRFTNEEIDKIAYKDMAF
ncbi:MAG: hypothetical protein K2P87_13075 [Lachnospiraceae bacterium]|nr:hypothetical protein [Lachnospiraceae bacterium]